MTTVTEGIGGFFDISRVSSEGFGDAAGCYVNALKVMIGRNSQSATSGRIVEDTRSSIDEIFEDCSTPDWAGSGEFPVLLDTYVEAWRMVAELPPSFRNAEVSPEPHGSIAFEWRQKQFHSLVISFSGTGRIEYAAMLGRGNRYSGTIVFSDILPAPVLKAMEDLRRS